MLRDQGKTVDAVLSLVRGVMDSTAAHASAPVA